MVVVKNEGKTAFVREVLEKDPRANANVVNKAWQDAGRNGTISTTLVQKVRADLGLTRNRGAAAKTAGLDAAKRRTPAAKERGPRSGPAKRSRTQANGAHEATAMAPGSQATSQGRAEVLDDLERDIDRLIFTIMGLGGLPEVEISLRLARRVLARSHEA